MNEFERNMFFLANSITTRKNENYTKAIAIIDAYEGDTFMAKDVNISGNTLSHLCDYGILKVIDKVETIIRVGYEHDITVKVNVYQKALKFTVKDLEREIYNYKINKLQREERDCKKWLKNVQEEIKELKEQSKNF